MPARNRQKQYHEQSYYHIYNRGVEKREIFLDDQDYHVFLSYVKTYVLPKDVEGLQAILFHQTSSPKEKAKALQALRLNNFCDTIDILAFCCMPNHFHFLVYQEDAMTIDAFMNSLCTRYAMYFNKRYARVGPLFQGVYKAVRIISEEQLLHTSRYIHRNPLKGQAFHKLEMYHYSSYGIYVGKRQINWVKPDRILSYFERKKTKNLSYQSFVERSDFNEEELWYVGNLI